MSGPLTNLFLSPCSFAAGATHEGALPPPLLPEVAFAGRSNVGKSSLINALTGQNHLARVSHTPGRTQQINFFDLGGRLGLVDMPGYGYAAVGKNTVAGWQEMIQFYLRGRVTLRRVCVLVDSRHGFKPVDTEIMDLLDEAAVPYQIVLTKVDEMKAEALEKRQADILLALKKHPAAFPVIAATSSRKGTGIAGLRESLAELAN
jgi:GTP-binding protein